MSESRDAAAPGNSALFIVVSLWEAILVFNGIDVRGNGAEKVKKIGKGRREAQKEILVVRDTKTLYQFCARLLLVPPTKQKWKESLLFSQEIGQQTKDHTTMICKLHKYNNSMPTLNSRSTSSGRIQNGLFLAVGFFVSLLVFLFDLTHFRLRKHS